uniref:BTB domain-containing protein n=1 Tax=Panagrolaimus sp. PS1159 TaxID=55785 RepID=A0AC35FHV6_9BILA
MDSIETKIANECQIKMKWRIKEEVLKDALNNLNDDTELIKSERLKASKILGVEYYLLLKTDKQNSNEINLFLQLEFEMARKIKATFNISVKSASYKKVVEKIYDNSDGFGETLCIRDKIFDAEKKFFVDRIMEIELDGTLKSRGIKRKSPESLSLVDILWENNEDKDITIIAEKQELKIHKWILCAKSPVFKAELNSGMKEARENRIEITDFSFEIVKIFVEDCYEQLLHHDVQFSLIYKISESNVVQLANASVTSNAKELREYYVCFLINAAEKSIFIKGAKNLREEITSEIGRRSLVSIVE